MKKSKIAIFFIMALLISTTFSAVSMNVKKESQTNVFKKMKSDTISNFKTINLDKLEINIDSSKNEVSNNLDVAIDVSNPTELNLMDDIYNIYEGLHWRLYVTVYWDPPQGEQICLWVDPDTLPEGATFPECICAIDSVTGTLDWTPAIGQAGTYEIVFYAGHSCYEPVGTFTVTVIVHPYEPEPYETYEIYPGEEWHLHLTAYWVPPQPERIICLWVDESTLPYGATFTDCHCDYGEVTGDLYWTPTSDQVGEYIITFLVGEDCGYYVFPYPIEVIVQEPEIPGIYFNQVNYRFYNDERVILDSYIGQIKVHQEELTSYYGIPTGYLNVRTSLGWVVQNLLVSTVGLNEEIPYIETKFHLRDGPVSGIDVTSIDVYLDFSSEPASEFYGGEYKHFPVDDTDWWSYNYFIPSIPPILTFPCFPTLMCRQSKHPCVQTACNQCCPAAVANSLQYLNNTYGIKTPHENIPGIGNTSSGKAEPPNSLVARLDQKMGRNPVLSRTNGAGVWPLEGKLKYINDTGLGNSIKIKYQGREDPFAKAGGVTVGKVKAKDMGAKTTFEFILQECQKGEDVELEFERPDGSGHCVELTGAGWKCGKPYIEYVSDLLQTPADPKDEKGCDTICGNYLKVDATGNVVSPVTFTAGSEPAGTVVEMVYSQSPNKPPNKPDRPNGPVKVKPGKEQTYTTNPAKDPDSDKIEKYEWDFDGDGKVDAETNTPSATHTWEKKGTYPVRVRARDEYGAVSEWSDPLSVSVPRNKAVSSRPILQFLENHPIIKILQRLFNL